jgi:Uma2 family endonuclease
VRDTEIAVPDIAGWRREHLPRIPRDPRFEVAPDRICNVLSPNTVKHDLIIKMPLYARYGVAFLWLVDPLAWTLEAYALQNGRWVVTGQFKDQDQATVEPFSALAVAG